MGQKQWAWNDTVAILKWVNLCLKPYVALNKEGVSHVIIDNYSSHKVEVVLGAIRSLGCIVSILPGGSTSQIQALDVGINKPFKANLQEMWTQFMINDNENNEKDVSREQVSHWVAEAFKKISSDSIVNTFRKIDFLSN